ncbi:phosphoribosylaminoimidazolesuccinocarboxamide synthase [Tsukamurella sp. NPDC003166]|uniref:phosphoribosylaminoimidazolesuccinocarboxamide synthase n=1 Tax=Tsukamurella sp. NPDC003166 TaxID=3154444 RepID=UPI0033B904C6
MRPELSEYTPIYSGKVRELYAVDDEHLLLVASDRISAYDYILDTPIPDKGRVLTAMSVFFFDALGVPNHLAGPADDPRIPEAVLGRALITRRLEMVPVECVARGYLTGSGLKEYRTNGEVCGVPLPAGLVDGSRIDPPIFTPATKAAVGDHDENVSFERVAQDVGVALATRLRELTLDVYARGADIARDRGIILADTKFEFGRSSDGDLLLADEVLTPDSSRYWDGALYEPGKALSSFDKQIVRDWLTKESGWSTDAGTPPPPLPGDVVERTRARYIEAYERIAGLSFADWPGGAA